jgi:hypothetical protein
MRRFVLLATLCVAAGCQPADAPPNPPAMTTGPARPGADQDKPNGTGKTPTAAANVVKVAAGKLWEAYQANFAAAEVKYAGQQVEISGVPAEVKKDAEGRYYLVAAEVRLIMPSDTGPMTGSLEDIERRQAELALNAQYLPGILLYIDKSELPHFAKADPKATVTVRGVCAGARKDKPGRTVVPDYAVVIDGCSLVTPGK